MHLQCRLRNGGHFVLDSTRASRGALFYVGTNSLTREVQMTKWRVFFFNISLLNQRSQIAMHTWWRRQNHDHIWFLRYVNLCCTRRGMRTFLLIASVGFAVGCIWSGMRTPLLITSVWFVAHAFLLYASVDVTVYIHVWRIYWSALLAFNQYAMVLLFTLTCLHKNTL